MLHLANPCLTSGSFIGFISEKMVSVNRSIILKKIKTEFQYFTMYKSGRHNVFFNNGSMCGLNLVKVIIRKTEIKLEPQTTRQRKYQRIIYYGQYNLWKIRS